MAPTAAPFSYLDFLSLSCYNVRMKVGITGTQVGLTVQQFETLKKLLGVILMDEIHAGDCVGVDAECIMLVKEIQPTVKTVGHPPINPSKRAFLDYDETRELKEYIDRNHDIVDECDTLIACPKQKDEVLRSGTWATVRYARKQEKVVIVIKPDGTWGV